MEGYFWRFTDVRGGRSVIALIGVQQDQTGTWALVGLGASSGSWAQAVVGGAAADPVRLGARAGSVFVGDDERVVVDLGPDHRLDVRLDRLARWPRRLFGGSSWFQTVPGLNQYWHPWLLGGRASGTAVVGGETWVLDGAQVYGEKNWGRGGFPESWWWGQAQGFAEPEACVAFAGGQVYAGPLRTEVTAVVVRLPGGEVLRLGNPVSSPVRATVSEELWRLRGRGVGGVGDRWAGSGLWSIEVDGSAPLSAAHVLPVPLVGERRAVPGALEHLSGRLGVVVRRGRREVWSGESSIAGLEHGGLELAAAEQRRRGG